MFLKAINKMKKLLVLLWLMSLGFANAANVALSDLGSMPAFASGDLLLMTDVSDTSADVAGTSKKATFSAFTSALTGLDSTQFADDDWGDITLASGVATVDADVLEIANMADGDWGDFSIATNSATLDAGVVDTGELAADAVDDTKVDWGTGANQVSGADVPLADSGAYFTTDDVESALQELGAAVPASKLVTFTLTLANVDDGADFDIAYVTEAFTITEMVAVHSGTGLSSPSIVVDVRHSTDRSAAGNQVETTAWTVTSSTSGAKLNSGFEDATVPADSFIWVETSGVSGTTDNLSIHVIGTYD